MTTTRLLWIALALAARPAAASYTANDNGTSAGQFLQLGADARSEAMGEAVHAECSNANAVYWNPAGLASLQYHEATFTHGAYYQGTFYEYASYAQPVPSVLGASTRERELEKNQYGSFGASLIYLNAGSISYVDNTGAPNGQTFTPSDFAFMAGWGVPLTEHLDIGMSGKYIRSKIIESAETGAFDMGARLHFNLFTLPYTMSGAVQNLGGRLRFLSQQETLPTSFAFGNSVRPTKNSVLSLDLVAPRSGNPYLALGGEYRIPFDPGMSAALRLGYNGRTSSGDQFGTTGISAGAGITYSRLSIDYAWMPYGLLGDTHRFSVSFRF